jgi:glutaredoxin
MKVAVIYTMKGCPHCTSIKEELNKENIPFLDRDINEFEEEYDEFSKATQNDFVPALMLLTLDEEENATDVKLLAPDRDFNDIYEGIDLIKEYLL